MTYADRGNLDERLMRLPPPWQPPAVAVVVDALADALDVLHRHGVIHRDLKPRNVLLRGTPDGGERVLLGDLGIAKDLQWASGVTVPTGSSGYAAPEQADFSEQIGPPTDVHALAMTAAELLGVRPPWPPTPLGGVLARATEPDPGRRTPTAPDFAAQFRAALAIPVAQPPLTTPLVLPPSAVPPPPVAQMPVAQVPLVQPPVARVPVAQPPPGRVPSSRHSHGPGPRPPGAWPPLRPPDLPTSRRDDLARLLLPMAAVTVIILALAVVGWAGWALTHRNQKVTLLEGRMSVEVPEGWEERTSIPFPGEKDSRAGIRMGSGSRSVSVAFRGSYAEPRAVLERTRPDGCTSKGTSTVTVHGWNGLVEHLTSCRNGVDISEVALARRGTQGGSVWIEVRSTGGNPGVTQVLNSLDIHP